MSYKCCYCGHEFKRKTTLQKHQSTAKYCLEQQGNYQTVIYKCHLCSKEYTRLAKFEQHMKICEPQIDKHPPINPDIHALHAENQRLTTQLEQLQSQIVLMMQGGRSLPIPQHPNTNNRNMVMNNLQPITDEQMQRTVEHLTLDFVLDGAKGYAAFANDYPFKDKLVCTDKSRKRIKYRDETGEIVDDIQGRKLTQRFFQSIAAKNNELVNNEYQLLQRQVADIAAAGNADEANLPELLSKSVKLQNTLRLCNEAAEGKNNELTQEFINHLAKCL